MPPKKGRLPSKKKKKAEVHVDQPEAAAAEKPAADAAAPSGHSGSAAGTP